MAGAFDGAPVVGVKGRRAAERFLRFGRNDRREMPDQVGHDRKGDFSASVEMTEKGAVEMTEKGVVEMTEENVAGVIKTLDLRRCTL